MLKLVTQFMNAFKIFLLTLLPSLLLLSCKKDRKEASFDGSWHLDRIEVDIDGQMEVISAALVERNDFLNQRYFYKLHFYGTDSIQADHGRVWTYSFFALQDPQDPHSRIMKHIDISHRKGTYLFVDGSLKYKLTAPYAYELSTTISTWEYQLTDKTLILRSPPQNSSNLSILHYKRQP